MALTAAQIQAKITALNTLYDSLAADPAESMTSPVGGSASFKKLTDIRKEITYWNRQLAAVNGTKVRPSVIRYGSPA